MHRHAGFFEQIGQRLVTNDAVGGAVRLAILARSQRVAHAQSIEQSQESREADHEHDHDCGSLKGIGLHAHVLGALHQLSLSAKPA